MKRVHLKTIFLLLIASTVFSQAFNQKYDIKGGGTPYDVVSADFNGDNIVDFAEINLNESTVSVFINKTQPADSIPSYYPKVDISTLASPASVVASDFNLDGLNDLAICSSGDNKITILLNTITPGLTTASFSLQTSLVTGKLPYQLDVGDLNFDGKEDLVVVNSQDDNVSIFLNTTTAGGSSISFSSATNLSVGKNPQSVKLLDFSGDNQLDIVTANYSDNSLSYLENQTTSGSQTLSFKTKHDEKTITNPSYIAVKSLKEFKSSAILVISKSSQQYSYISINLHSDPLEFFTFSNAFKYVPTAAKFGILDGNLRPDIIVTFGQDSLVGIMLSPSISTSTMNYFNVGQGPSSISVSDVNRDGKKDLLVTNAADNSISILYNQTITSYDNFQFQTQKSYKTDGPSSDIASKDLNNDGLADIAVSNWNNSSVSIFINQSTEGESVIEFSTRKDFKILDTGSDIELEDVNNDGKPDIIATNWADSVSIMINQTKDGDTNAVFSKPYNFDTGYQAGPNAATLADLNMDGKLDLAISNQFPNINSEYHISVLLNTTTLGDSVPSFTTFTSLPASDGPWEIKSADFNLDLKPDIAVANFSVGTVSIFTNNTKIGDLTPSFSPKVDYSVGQGASGLDLADLNGDGLIDIATANQNSDSIAILMNITPLNSQPSFAKKFGYQGEYGPNFMNIQDMDGDGKPELLVANSSAQNVFSIFFNGWYLSEFNPYFGDMTSFPTDSLPVAITAADFNHDDIMDVATVNQISKTMRVFLNTTTVTAIEDNSEPITSPSKFVLSQNYPNPFNPSTNIKFTIPQNASNQITNLSIFDILGRKVATLVNEVKAPGKYIVEFDGSELSSGIYFYRLINNNSIQTRKMMLLK